MYYILTTFYPDHWNNVPNNRTSYLRKFLSVSSNQLVNNTPTIFLRINRGLLMVEKAWLGVIHNIEYSDTILNFSIKIESELDVKLKEEFIRTKIGWFVINSDLNPDDLVLKKKPDPNKWN
jgi:hypothetical protein